jgi:hypothetical protein
MTSKGDTLHGIKGTAIIEEDGETSHTEDGIINFNGPNNFLTFLFSKAV